MVAQALHDFQTSTMINGKGGLLVVVYIGALLLPFFFNRSIQCRLIQHSFYSIFLNKIFALAPSVVFCFVF